MWKKAGVAEMTDREKVIKGLECCNEFMTCKANCPYRNDGCREILSRDALALLKSQEPVEPILDIDTWKCGDCGHALEHQQLLGDNVLFHEQYNYCPECGRAVKWDD